MTRKIETVTQKTIVKKVESRIYIGPSFKGVTSGTVFINELTPALNEAIKTVPAISELVIYIKKIVFANKELANPDSALSRCYKVASEYKKGE